jgi:hypothetical protein
MGVGEGGRMNLKYRIWNETEKRYLTPDEATVTPDGKIVGWDGAKDDCVVEVWTGMVDAKGVEICEGDIVRSKHGNATVNWDADECKFYMRDDGKHSRMLFNKFTVVLVNIIGNIHEGVK